MELNSSSVCVFVRAFVWVYMCVCVLTVCLSSCAFFWFLCVSNLLRVV